MPFRPLIRAIPAFVLVAVAALVIAPGTRSPVGVVEEVEAGIVEPRTQSDGPVPRNPELFALRAQALLPEPKPTPAERAVSYALEAVGIPYHYGGGSPESGFDCSGLVRWAYGRAGLDVPHNSYALYGVGRRVAKSRLETGDVLFFEGLGHVGLYLGGGEMVHAPYTGKRVEVIELAETNYGKRLIGARRMSSPS
jgi:cell wall-associated NlpC family hydrolase